MFKIFSGLGKPAVTPQVPSPLQAPPAAPVSAQAEADRCIEAGNDLEDQDQPEAALVHYQQALQRCPDYWKAHLNLGNAYRLLKNDELAFTHYQAAHQRNPDSPGACYNLGLELVRLQRPLEAIPLLEAAIRLRPDFADAMVVLAEALESVRQLEPALAWLNRALTLRPDEAGVVFNKLITLEKLERYEEGEVVARQLIQLPEGLIPGLDYLAEYAKKYGEVKKALEYYRQMPPGRMKRTTFSNYLLTLSYDPDLDPAWVLAEHRRVNDYLERTAPVSRPPRLPRARRRIGFLSPDFRAHPVANFILRLFELLDRSRFEVWGYYTHTDHDTVTEQLRQSLDGWRELSDTPAAAAAECIAQDGIDILIDLAGHTGGNRLDVLALKPAPVIATWLGYLGTTGVPEVDYRIVDGYTDPPGMTEAHHSERLARLAHCQWCYMPRDDHPAVGPLPAERNGFVTFGSFNNFVKIGDPVLALWAQLLARVPGSRLLIAAIPEGRSRQRVTEFFTAQGVAADRLEFIGRTTFVQYLANYNRIDIALDSFPYNGGTTTCNALYMGVPVLTLAGRHSVARSGVSLMSNVGLPEWVADSEPAFLAQGVRLAADVAGLARLRAGLRARFMASPLGDQAQFARDFGALLDEMWTGKGLPHVTLPRDLEGLRAAHAQAPADASIGYALAERLVHQGSPKDAIALLQALVAREPGATDALLLLGQALQSDRQPGAALTVLEQARQQAPQHPQVLFHTLGCLEALQRFDEGEALAQVLARQFGWENAGFQFLAKFARRTGQIEQSLAYHRQALSHGVDYRAYSNYLMALLSSAALDPVQALAERRKINAFFADVRPLALPEPRQPHPRHIGFISADLRTHAVAFFIEKLWARLTALGYRLTAYAAGDPALQDAMTERLRGTVQTWRPVHGQAAAAVARQIAEDGVDILIDLSGHTGGNRLDVLAHRPAPVQATWLGYLASTGLDAVDFRIVDGYTDPPGMTEAHHSERLVRLAHSQWCYAPDPTHPSVQPLPALTNGHVTFGAFNSFAKTSQEALDLWADLLLQVPGSRLLMAAIPEGRPRQWIGACFQARGVAPDRWEILPHADRARYMAYYHRIDIALDAFPYNGGTTTCDALYMGVPVLTLAGRHSVARSGVSLMSNVGLPEWVADSEPAFLAQGVRLAADVAGLARLRSGLRARFMASPLGDQAQFAQDFVAVLDEMWIHRCATRGEQKGNEG